MLTSTLTMVVALNTTAFTYTWITQTVVRFDLLFPSHALLSVVSHARRGRRERGNIVFLSGSQ